MKKVLRPVVLALILVTISGMTGNKKEPLAAQPETTAAPIVAPTQTPKSTSTPTPTPALVIVEEEITPLAIPTEYFDIPLSDELQDHIFEQCETYELDKELVVAIIWQESTYDPTLISKTNDYGLMQINKCNHAWLRTDMGLTDMLDPYENVQAGCIILSNSFSDAGGDYHKALMTYNMGLAGAKRHWAQGTTSSVYSRAVMDKYSKIKELYR